MAVVARISAKSGKSVRTVVLRKGVNVLAADADATVSLIDDVTGKPIDGAQLVRHGSEISVSIPDSFFAASGAQAPEGAPAGGTGEAPPAETASAGASSGGGSGLVYGLLGAAALGGLAVAAGGGGGGDKTPTPPADTTPPAAPTGLVLTAADDTGSSNSDRVTSQTSGLTITGTVEANATVTIVEGGTTLGTGTANASGAFSIDIALAAGAHNITATARDAAGNTSTASTALAITVDTTAPTVAITSSLTALVLGQTATLTFTFSEAPAGFAAGDIAITGGTVTGLAVSPNNPNVYTATLTPTAAVSGPIAVSIAGGAFTDTAGSAGGAGSLNLTYDPGASGQAIDGYIANALVFRDTDNDGAWDHEAFTDANNNGLFDTGEVYVDADGNGTFTAEAAVKTDGEGNFTGLLGTGRIVLTPLTAGNGTNLTTDISTGQAFTGKLAAPDGSTVVTPLTTLVEAVAGAGASAAQIAAAQTQVKAALGLSASVDLTTLDPIAAVASGNAGAVADALAVQKAATQVANILAVIGSASEAAGAAGGKDAGVAAATSAIAAQITAGGTLDLASAAVIEQVAQSVATTTGGTAGADIAAQAAALGSSLANVNTVIAEASGDSAAGTLAAVVAAQIVAQENLADDVSAAIANNTVVDSSAYQGAALADKVDQAATEVEVVIPAEPAPAGAPGAPDRPVVDDGARVSAAEAADGVTVTIAYGGAANIAAGDTLRLLIGDVVVKSVVLTAGDIAAGSSTIALSAADLGADGAKSITAGLVSAAGLAGNVSLAAIVTLDTGIPAAPSAIVLTEGGLLTRGEAVDGTVVSGSTEAGSTVTFTLFNGETELVKEAKVIGAAFTLVLTAAEIQSLGEGTIGYSAVARDAAGNESPVSVAGQFVYTTQAVAAANVRVDDAATPVVGEDESNLLGVTPLRGGGFAVHWIVDDNGDGDGDSIAVQRFDADGNRAGGITVLQGVDDNLVDNAAEDAAYDLTALDNGGYALTYTLALAEGGRSVMLSQTAPSTGIIGIPDEIILIGAPVNAAYALTGLGTSGSQVTVNLTASGGVIEITQDMLSQFVAPNRLSLVVSNLTVGQTVNAIIDVAQDVSYDLDASLIDVVSSRTVTQNGPNTFAVLIAGGGRPETFHIDSMSGTPTNVSLQITPINGPGSVNLNGIPNVNVLPNGVIIINNPTPDANGVYRIPQQILDSIGDDDFQAFLLVSGLPVGSTLTGTVGIREATPAPHGVFAQTFDADGNALGDAGTRIDPPSAPFVNVDDDLSVRVTPLAGGGFAVNWIVDADSDGDADQLAVQRFAADGSKIGDAVLLTGFSTDLLDLIDDGGSFDLQALEGGGYALAYSQTPDMLGGGFQVAGPAANAAINGRPTFLYVGNAPAGLTYKLTGAGTDGQPKTVILVPENGSIEFPSSVLGQFAVDNRFTLQVEGLAANQTAPLHLEVAQEIAYDRGAPLSEVISDRVVAAGGPGIVAANTGLVEAFRIDAMTGTPTNVLLIINPAVGRTISLPPGAIPQPNGSILLFNPTPDAQGFYRIPESILAQLEGHDFSSVLVLNGLPAGSQVLGTALVREPVFQPEGVFVQTFGPDGAALGEPTPRLDGGSSVFVGDEYDGSGTLVTPLNGGGFAVNWLVDVNGDGDPENIAVQRFAADGSKAGDVVVMQGIAEELLEQVDEDGAYDFQALDNGGYVLTYSLTLEEAGMPFTLNQQVTNLAIVGRPSEIFVASAPPNATFTFSGVGPNGTAVVFNLVPEDGVILITSAMLDQLAVDYRGSLLVSGLTAGQTVTGFIETFESVSYDLDAPLVDVVSDRIVPANGIGVIAVAGGRPEAFHVDSLPGTPTFVSMSITPIFGGQSINVAGIPNAFVAPNGTININSPVPDANGVYHVPQQILNQIGENDFQALLVLGGLPIGSSLVGTVSLREAIPEIEGVFVQTFGPDGSLLSEGMEFTGTAGADSLVGDRGSDLLHGLGGSDILVGGGGDDVLDGGAGQDTLTGGAGADLFILDAPGGQTLSVTDLVTDFQSGTDHLRLPGAVTFADVSIVQGDPGTNGGLLTDSLIIHAASGDILARMANTDAATITQASFM